MTPNMLLTAFIFTGAFVGIGALALIVFKAAVKGNWFDMGLSALLVGTFSLMMLTVDPRTYEIMLISAIAVSFWCLHKYWDGIKDDQPKHAVVFPVRERFDYDGIDGWR